LQNFVKKYFMKFWLLNRSIYIQSQTILTKYHIYPSLNFVDILQILG
jgi:hypothetical protein